MSLLQEALKRKEQDESQRKPEVEKTENVPSAPSAETAKLSLTGPRPAEIRPAGSPPDNPPLSMPAVEQVQAVAVQNVKHKASMWWMIVAVVAGLTVTAGITFLFYRTSSPQKAKTVQQAKPAHDLPAVAAAVSMAGPVARAVSVPRKESAATAQTITSQPAAPGAGKEAASAGPQTQNFQSAETKSVQAQSAGIGETKPPSAKSAGIKQKKSPGSAPASVNWPVLKLMGILRGAGNAESTAFINGKIVSAGQAIADVTVVEVKADGVILKYGNEQRFLRVGATSY